MKETTDFSDSCLTSFIKAEVTAALQTNKPFFNTDFTERCCLMGGRMNSTPLLKTFHVSFHTFDACHLTLKSGDFCHVTIDVFVATPVQRNNGHALYSLILALPHQQTP